MLMARHRLWPPRRVLAAGMLLAAAVALTGCASIGDSMPAAIGGLPENAPQRPATPPAYPSVHDRPPERASTVLSGSEQKKLEDELAAARNKAAPGANRNP